MVNYAGLDQTGRARGCADAHEHLYELGAGDREERNSCLAGNCFCQEGFARSRGTDQEHTLGDAGTQGDEFLRFTQKFHDLLELLFGFIHASDILKGNSWMIACKHARPGFAK